MYRVCHDIPRINGLFQGVGDTLHCQATSESFTTTENKIFGVVIFIKSKKGFFYAVIQTILVPTHLRGGGGLMQPSRN